MTSADIVAAWDALGGTPPKNMTRWCFSLDNSSRGKVYNALYAAERLVPKGKAAEAPQVDKPEDTAWKEAGDAATLEAVIACDEQVITLEHAIAKSGLDTSVWYVDRWEFASWGGAMKLRMGQDEEKKNRPDKGFLKTFFRVKLFVKRIAPKPQLDALNALFGRMASHAPAYPAVDYGDDEEPHLFVLGMTDVHIGALSWARETGENVDLHTSEARYLDAVADLIRSVRGYAIGSVLIPCGSDLLHVDTPGLTTTSGTPLEADGRYAKIIETVQMACVKGIEMAAQVAPVRVVYVPGNHDQYSSLHTARFLAAWFRNHPNVTVDCEPTSRKYHQFGTTLIGMTHGHREKRSELPIIMATEKPQEWATSTSREFLIGHTHQSKVSHSTPVDSQAGVIVRTMRSLAGTDAYHASLGYIGKDQAAEGYLYSKISGYRGHFIARPRRAPINVAS